MTIRISGTICVRRKNIYSFNKSCLFNSSYFQRLSGGCMPNRLTVGLGRFTRSGDRWNGLAFGPFELFRPSHCIFHHSACSATATNDETFQYQTEKLDSVAILAYSPPGTTSTSSITVNVISLYPRILICGRTYWPGHSASGPTSRALG